MPDIAESPQTFGGDWTREKLDILSAYLNAYTTALKNQPFRLTYVDAFAGSGSIELDQDDDQTAFLQGSVQRALEVTDKSFDSLLFIEQNSKNAHALRTETALHADRVTIVEGDANEELPRYCNQMDYRERAVVFLDPFALEVDWEIVEALAKTRKCDVWILFPVSSIRRILPLQHMPSEAWQNRLNRAYGDESWRDFYSRPDQRLLPFLDDDRMESDPGVNQIIERYRARLNSIFAEIAPTSRTLRNSQNSPLFEFIFAASNPKGANVAIRIADHILKKM